MSIFAWSDPHINHVNILKPEYCDRPFKDVDHMNEMLVQNFNSVVGPNDFTICDGDLLMGKISDGVKFLYRLNGELGLVEGNHDEKALRQNPHRFRERFSWIKTEHEIPAALPNGRQITLQFKHYPLNHDDNGKLIEKLPENFFRVNGHSHGKFPFDPAKPQFDCGVDSVEANYFPIPLEKILEIAQQHFDFVDLEKKTRPHP